MIGKMVCPLNKKKQGKSRFFYNLGTQMGHGAISSKHEFFVLQCPSVIYNLGTPMPVMQGHVLPCHFPLTFLCQPIPLPCLFAAMKLDQAVRILCNKDLWGAGMASVKGALELIRDECKLAVLVVSNKEKQAEKVKELSQHVSPRVMFGFRSVVHDASSADIARLGVICLGRVFSAIGKHVSREFRMKELAVVSMMRFLDSRIRNSGPTIPRDELIAYGDILRVCHPDDFKHRFKAGSSLYVFACLSHRKHAPFVLLCLRELLFFLDTDRNNNQWAAVFAASLDDDPSLCCDLLRMLLWENKRVTDLVLELLFFACNTNNASFTVFCEDFAGVGKTIEQIRQQGNKELGNDIDAFAKRITDASPDCVLDCDRVPSKKAKVHT
jgi:hypothetical protein